MNPFQRKNESKTARISRDIISTRPKQSLGHQTRWRKWPECTSYHHKGMWRLIDWYICIIFKFSNKIRQWKFFLIWITMTSGCTCVYMCTYVCVYVQNVWFESATSKWHVAKKHDLRNIFTYDGRMIATAWLCMSPLIFSSSYNRTKENYYKQNISLFIY